MTASVQAKPRLAALKENLDELGTASPLRLLFRYSWPALVAMTLNALYNVIDRFYIGQGCGADAMAGLTLTFPLMMLFGAFGVFVGAGHSTVLSIKLGEGDRVGCEKLLGELVALKLLLFLVLPPLVFLNLDTVLVWCGADKVTPGAFEAAKTYLRIVLFSHLFSHLAFGLSAMQRAEGGAMRSMMSMVVGFGANLVLDPIFIFGLGLGVAGAAWATVIAMFASFLWAARYYVRRDTVIAFRWRRIRLYREFLWRTTSVGFSPFVSNVLSSLIGVSLSVAFAKWAASPQQATDQIASLGVFQAALILVFMPMMGTMQGLQPIFGYNWGARNFGRVLETLKSGFGVLTALAVFAFVVQVVPPFPRWLARCFVSADNPALIDLAAHDLAVSNCMIWMISINVTATVYFQSIGKPAIATWLSVLRQGVVLLPVIWFLPRFMDDKMLAIWLSMPVSDIICQLATLPPLLLHARFLARLRTRLAGRL